MTLHSKIDKLEEKLDNIISKFREVQHDTGTFDIMSPGNSTNKATIYFNFEFDVIPDVVIESIFANGYGNVSCGSISNITKIVLYIIKVYFLQILLL